MKLKGSRVTPVPNKGYHNIVGCTYKNSGARPLQDQIILHFH